MLDTASDERLYQALTHQAGPIDLAVFDSLDAVADDWRAFEATADCTAFQTFAWQSAWQTHIGAIEGARPAIVMGRQNGRLVFIMPFQIERGGFARRLTWHASDLCDYNAPLLAPDFARLVPMGAFPELFERVLTTLRSDPRFAFDTVILEKMPEMVGEQPNPFMEIATTPNPSGAHAARLFGTWDTFYTEKRSSATRRRDRTKRKRLGEIGEVALVEPGSAAAIDAALSVLMAQKSAAFARMGVGDLFARPGHAAFYRAVAVDPANRDFVHVSHLDVGGVAAAVNLGLVFRGTYYHVLASYGDGPAAKFGPGAAHLHDLMAHAIGRGCTVFDFTIGDERYKTEWSDMTLTLHDHRRAATVRGTLVTLPATVKARVKLTIKQTPALWALAVRVRSMAAALKGRASKPASQPEAETE